MNKNFIAFALFLILINYSLSAQTRARTEINIPDIMDYKTLKCDFHMHTVFSDGLVWPSIRPEEAWRQGLDAIALTDHIEYTPHKDDININFNRPYEIAKPAGDKLDIIVIKGSEITRGMPPGHCNAIFLTDASKLIQDDWRDAFKEAKKQDAFIFWNHPGWKSQQPDGISKWYEEHTWLLKNNMLNGIEVVNERDYYPEVFQWCLDKNLTILCNTDVHDPVQMFWEIHDHDFRPVTLVFAKEKTEASIKEALFAGRTAAYATNSLFGKEQFVRQIFNKSVSINKTDLVINGKRSVNIMFKNDSDIDYKLVSKNKFEELSFNDEITLYANKTVILSLRGTSNEKSDIQKFELLFEVQNIKINSEENLMVSFPLNITFVPVEKM